MTKAPKTATPRKSKVDPNESKSQKFKRLAGARMTVALRAVGSIANLAGPGYEYTPEQVQRLTGDLQKQVDRVKRSFETGGPGRQGASYSL